MSDVLNLRKEITAFNKSERFDAYSKVIINVNDDLSYEAGDNTGRTLTLSCPWGTKAMAKNILSQMRGFSYQPYTATGAILDPASEIGDGINVNGVYSGIYRMDTTFNSHCSTDISAPSDEEIDYEYQYRSKQQREVSRKNKYFSSQLLIHSEQISAEVEQRTNDVAVINGKLTVQSDMIEAEVNQRGEDVKQINAKLTLHSNQITAEVSERKSDIKSVKSTLEIQSSQIVAKVNKNYGSSSTFGWALETDSWRIFAGSSTVLKATKSGLEIKGKITATSGKIGGFDILSNYISYNGQTWRGTNTNGIYIGPYGIQLGKNFRVDNSGNLYATTGTFTGNVYAKSIKFDDENATSVTYGTLSGGAISAGSISGGKISYDTLTTANMIDGIKYSLSYADFANGVFNGWNTANTLSAYSVSGNDVFADTLNVSNTIYFGYSKLYLGTITDYEGDVRRVVMWSN